LLAFTRSSSSYYIHSRKWTKRGSRRTVGKVMRNEGTTWHKEVWRQT